jgi:hypothetical protein
MTRLAKRATCVAAVLVGAFTMLAVTADYSDARGIRGTTAGSVHRGGGGFSRGGGARASRGGAQFASHQSRGAVRSGEISRSGQMAQRGTRAGGGEWASTGAQGRTDYNRQRFDNRADMARRDANYTRRDANYYRRDSNYYRRDVNYNDIDVNVDHGWDGYHPVARGVAYGTAAAVTAAAIGSVAYSLPPSCATYPYYGYSYYRCGDVWYQPQYSGDQVTYVVVEQPG